MINHEYGKKAEEVIKVDYTHFMNQKKSHEKFEQRFTNTYFKLLDFRKNSMIRADKPLYKMKMFQSVDSKVKNQIENFKTFYKLSTGKRDELDNMIDKVQNEINQIDNNNNNKN